MYACILFFQFSIDFVKDWKLVSDNFRGIGINSEMKDGIIKYCKELPNINKITCNVRQSNESSINSLLKIGFEINNNVDMIYPDGEKKIPLYYKLK